jgi:hypothetical protein
MPLLRDLSDMSDEAIAQTLPEITPSVNGFPYPRSFINHFRRA